MKGESKTADRKWAEEEVVGVFRRDIISCVFGGFTRFLFVYYIQYSGASYIGLNIILSCRDRSGRETVSCLALSGIRSIICFNPK